MNSQFILKKHFILKKSIGDILIEVIVEQDYDNMIITMPDQKSYKAYITDNIIKCYGEIINYNGQKYAGIQLSDEVLENINNFKKEAKKKFFLENKQSIYYNYSSGYSITHDMNYSQEALKRVFEAHKVKNDDYDPFDDGFTTPYIFPKMLGKDLIKLLDEAEAEVIKERQEKEIQEQKALEAKFEEARRTGKPVLIKREGGMNSNNFDEGWTWVYITYAMPNGTIKKEKKQEIWD